MGFIKRVTIKEVAERAGVSVTTVSRVLNGRDLHHIRQDTKARVLSAMKELNYVPVRAAQRLRKQKAQLMAILLPDISNPFFALLARGAESAAFNEGFSALICDSDHSEEKEASYLDILMEEGVDGIIFVPVGQPDVGRVERLIQRGTTIVLADRDIPGFPIVEVDNEGASYEITRLVLERGYRSLAYLSGPQVVSTARARLEGFLRALEEDGLEPTAVVYGQFTYQSGYQHTLDLLRANQIDALVAGNDLMAMGAVRAAEELGLRVPQDIGVTGFDRIPWSEFFRPTLTTVEIPTFEIGVEAMKLVLAQDNERRIRLPARVVLGSSISWRP